VRELQTITPMDRRPQCGLIYGIPCYIQDVDDGRARLILREKIIDEEGSLTEFVIWEIRGTAPGS